MAPLASYGSESFFGVTPCMKEHIIPFGGPVVREYRNGLNVSLRSFAELVEMDSAAVSRYETGQVAMKLPVLETFAKALGVRPEKLLRDAHSRYLADLRVRYQDDALALEGIEAINDIDDVVGQQVHTPVEEEEKEVV